MARKTISDLKDKLIEAVDSIDVSKITIYDLKTLADTVSVISGINENTFDVAQTFLEMSKKGFSQKPITLSDLKGDE
ncbi:MAG: hypothetical protein J6K17_00180 [Oscillospiraceae bacterium]|nr:hypothetical protein [Oscillospiraceae bacterium]